MEQWIKEFVDRLHLEGKSEVEEFRQRILQSEGCSAKRNYAIVTIMAYAGLRISEVLTIKKVDVNTTANQIRVMDGKGGKQRTVIINSKIVSTIREYEKSDNVESEYLFHNSRGNILNVMFQIVEVGHLM